MEGDATRPAAPVGGAAQPASEGTAPMDAAQVSGDDAQPASKGEAPMDAAQVPGDADAALPPATDTVPQESTDTPMRRSAPTRRPVDERQRGRRMLGVLHSTLAQARSEPRPRRSAPDHVDMDTSDAVERRAQQDALAAERRAHDADRAAVRAQVQRVHELAERIAAHEAASRTARAHKRRLSSFLVTHTAARAGVARPPRDGAEATATSLARTAPEVPLAGTRDDYEVYYLPRTLLPAQEDALDAQEERVDDEIERADDDWDQARAAMQEELQSLQRSLAQHRAAW